MLMQRWWFGLRDIYSYFFLKIICFRTDCNELASCKVLYRLRSCEIGLKLVTKYYVILNDAISKPLEVRFTNNLHQHKPSYGIKKLLPGLTKDMRETVAIEKTWTEIILPLFKHPKMS